MRPQGLGSKFRVRVSLGIRIRFRIRIRVTCVGLGLGLGPEERGLKVSPHDGEKTVALCQRSL